ncbi:MAG: radical SAM protein [Desulfobacterales bacterium]|nr:radical SAM protein [Desulfobacterales bacterium]
MARFETKKKFQLLMGLIHGRRAYTGPFYVDLDVTRRCNLRCIGCPFHSSTKSFKSIDETVKDISMDLIDRLSRELPQLGVYTVIIAGASEPLLHPRLAEIISKFKKSGVEVHLITNGTLLNKDRAQEIIHSGLDRLIVSLWASSRESYAKCHPGTNSDNFMKIVENLKQFSKVKSELNKKLPVVFLQHVCNIHTYKTIDDKIDIAKSTGCDGVRFSHFTLQGDRSAASAILTDDQTQFLLQSLPQIRKRMESLSLEHNITKDGVLVRYRFGCEAWRKVPCFVGWYRTRIMVDGGVNPCCRCDLLLGNLHKNSLEEIWNNQQYQSFRSKMKTKTGLVSLSKCCNCDWCCYIDQNFHIHKIFRWLAPFSMDKLWPRNFQY